MPGLDLRALLEGTLERTVESDQSLSMSTKYAAQTPYCFARGFPVLKMRPELRLAASEALANNRPSRMLYALA